MAERPQPGDFYLIPDDQGRWAHALRFVSLHHEDPGVGVFQDDVGETYVCGFEALRPARLAHVERPGDDPVQAAETRRYRQRSRVTAQQRANRTLTAKQRATIFALGNRRGMDLDDLRGMTPQGSVSKLTMREAGVLIDRLKGRRVGT